MNDLAPATTLAARNRTRHPNESDEYRRARQELLVEEIELRRQMARVAEQRRDLPLGGEVPDDYHFVAEDGTDVTLSDLFGEHDTLAVYSYMFGPDREAPCPMCTSLMGGFEQKIPDIRQRVGVAFTARSPIERLIDAKRARGLTNMSIFSDMSGDYTRAYVSADDADVPAYNVFTRKDGVIRHFWSEEISGEMADPDQYPASPHRSTRRRSDHRHGSSTKSSRVPRPQSAPPRRRPVQCVGGSEFGAIRASPGRSCRTTRCRSKKHVTEVRTDPLRWAAELDADLTTRGCALGRRWPR